MKRGWKIAFTVLLYAVLTVAGASYFYFAGKLYGRGRKSEVCKAVKVTLLDSSLNKFVSKQEVVQIIERFQGPIMDKHIDSLNLKSLEELLNHRSVVKESQIFVTRDGQMNIQIRQRRPIIRVEGSNGGFYIDGECYIFPLIERYSSYVPVVSGNIPQGLLEGSQAADSLAWVEKIVELGRFLESNPFWNAQIEQIYFNDKQEIELATRAGNERVIFGELKDIPQKFNKLYSYYKYVTPKVGWEKYSTINLKYKNQIVCTLNKKDATQEDKDKAPAKQSSADNKSNNKNRKNNR